MQSKVRNRKKDTIHIDTDFIQKITNLTPSLITVYNVQTGDYIYVNYAVKLLLGYEPRDWIKKGFVFVSQLVHPDDLIRISKENQQALEKENNKKRKSTKSLVVPFEYRIKAKNGKWRWVNTYGTVFDRDEEGRVRHVLNISIDITERKEIEEKYKQKEEELHTLNKELEKKVTQRTKALQQSEAKLKEAQRITKMGSWEYDLIKQKVYWSDEIYKIHGLDPQQGEPDYETLLTLYQEPRLIEKSVQKAVTKGRPYKVDVPIIYKKDKSLRYIQAIGRPIKNAKGEIVKLYGTTIDITERKFAELNTIFLSEASKGLSTSLDYKENLKLIAKIAVNLFADACAIEMVESGVLKLIATEHKNKKMLPMLKKLYEMRRPISSDKKSGMAQVLKTGKAVYIPFYSEQILELMSHNKNELEMLKKGELTSRITVPIIYRGKPVGGISFFTTNSKRKYTKLDLRIAEELAFRVSLALENGRLYKEAQEAIQIRDDFISIASHELKTPITSMKMYAQYLERLASDNEHKRFLPYLHKINEQINKHTQLISDLLDVSKIQRGKLELRKEYFDMCALLDEIVENMKLSITSHKIVVTKYSECNVFGDRDRIGQVVVNLITNAAKYSPNAKKILVNITNENNSVKVSVRDYGIGVSKKSQSKIFERFYQANDISGKTYPGLGIGLYISKEIVTRHKGEITIKSKVGKGSTFSFTLPITGH